VKSPLLLQWGNIYNKWGDPSPPLWLQVYPHNCLTSLWLFYSYMTLHILYMSFRLPLYNTFSNKNLHNPKIMWHMMTHYMTWHYWHGLQDDMAMSRNSFLLLALCLLEDTTWSLLPPQYGLEMRGLQCYLDLKIFSKLDVPFLLLNWSTYICNYIGVF